MISSVAAQAERVAAKKQQEEKEAAEKPAKRAAAAERVAACVGAARAQIDAEGGSLAAEVLEENASLQDDERVVLQSMFEEDECELLEAPEGYIGGVRLRVAAPNKKGVEQAVALRALMPPEYPSHLPPTVEIVDGIEGGKAEAAYVADQLTLYFFDEFVGTCVLPMWAEWLRDEWIAKQSGGGGGGGGKDATPSAEPSADCLLKFGKA